MINIIKSDFFRVIKDKTLYIMLGVIFAFTFLNVALINVVQEEEANFLGDQLSNGSYAILSNFSMSSNLGFIIPICLVIFVIKDFTYGTIRNKLIAGYSKTTVFFSLFFLCFISGTILLFSTLILTFIFVGIFGIPLSFSSTLILKLGLGYLVFITAFALVTLVTSLFKSTGISILCLFGLLMFFVLAIGLTAGVDVAIIELINDISNLSIYQLGNDLITGGDKCIEDGLTLKICLGCTIPSCFMLLIGCLIFNKADLK